MQPSEMQGGGSDTAVLAEQPPVDNQFVAPGAELFDEQSVEPQGLEPETNSYTISVNLSIGNSTAPVSTFNVTLAYSDGVLSSMGTSGYAATGSMGTSGYAATGSGSTYMDSENLPVNLLTFANMVAQVGSGQPHRAPAESQRFYGVGVAGMQQLSRSQGPQLVFGPRGQF
jgi:hypothetical protein